MPENVGMTDLLQSASIAVLAVTCLLLGYVTLSLRRRLERLEGMRYGAIHDDRSPSAP